MTPSWANVVGFWRTAADDKAGKIKGWPTVADAGGQTKSSLPDIETLRQAIHATFVRRGTHAEPVELEPPPEDWRAAFAQFTAEMGLRATTLDAAFEAVAAFWRTLVT